MSNFIFSNNVSTTLAAAASPSDTVLTLTSSANLPGSIPSGYYLPLTLKDQATGLTYEVVYVTSITGAQVTCLRAQEGFTAQAWSIGDYIYCSPTAQSTQPVTTIYEKNGSDGSNVITLTGNITLTQADSGNFIDAWNAPSGTIITLPFSGATFPNGWKIRISASNAAITISNPSSSPVYAEDGSILIASGGTYSPPNGLFGSAMAIYASAGAAYVDKQGRKIVSPAVNSNEATAKSQLLQTAPIYAYNTVNGLGPISATTASFTAPCNGNAIIIGTGTSTTGTMTAASISASLGGLVTLAATPFARVADFYAYLPMSTGQSSTFTASVTQGATGNLGVFLKIFFQPTP